MGTGAYVYKHEKQQEDKLDLSAIPGTMADFCRENACEVLLNGSSSTADSQVVRIVKNFNYDKLVDAIFETIEVELREKMPFLMTLRGM